MKKLRLILAATCAAFTLTGCSNTPSMEDCLNSNKGTSNYHHIMKTENGYYYNSAFFGNLALRYHDNATGNDIYLCAKPECTHDGDKFCTATSEGFDVLYTGLYDGNIYITATETDEKRVYLRLLKASLNGTELTEVCTIIQTSGSADGIKLYHEDLRSMVLHRGYAFVPYYLSNHGTELVGKAGLAIVNLSDGSVQYLPEYEQSETKGYINVTPYGDYIYYTMAKTEFHRYNFKTGEDEIIPLKASLKETYGNDVSKYLTNLTNFVIIDDKVWYTWGGTKLGEALLFIYDPEANTTVLSEAFKDKLLRETEEYDENGELYAIFVDHYVEPDLLYDGTYLYVAEGGFFASEYLNHDMQVHIFTLEGERLGGFIFERSDSGSCQINIVDETFYIQTTEGTVCCPVADVISGNVAWKELYQFEKGED